MVSPHVLPEPAFRHADSVREMLAVHVAERDETALPVACEVIGRASYAARSDDGFCELVARSYVSVASKHVARDDGEQSYGPIVFRKERLSVFITVCC